jgi:hypothetical protein
MGPPAAFPELCTRVYGEAPIMNSTWGFPGPGPDALNYTDCKLASEWVGTMNQGADIGIETTLKMLRNGLAAYLIKNNVSDPGNAELMRWALHWQEPANKASSRNDLIFSMLAYGKSQCLERVCQLLPWQGFSGLAGKGVRLDRGFVQNKLYTDILQMVASYMTQATLATIYTIVLLMMRFDCVAQIITGKRIQPDSRFVTAVKHSAKTFLDTSLIFSVAMLAAGCFVYLGRFTDSNSSASYYIMVCTLLLSIYTILPALLLHICISDSLRRHRGRMVLWAGVWLLSLTLFVFWLVFILSPEKYKPVGKDTLGVADGQRQAIWELFCMESGIVRSTQWAIYTLIAGVNVLGLSYFALSRQFVVTYFRRNFQILSRFKTTDQSLRTLRLLLATASISLMWWCLARFMLFRDTFKRRAGTSNKDHEWSFGQVLSLASWVPVLVELAYLCWEGPQAGLTGQLMEPYEVKETGAVELGHARNDGEMELLPHEQGKSSTSRVAGNYQAG